MEDKNLTGEAGGAGRASHKNWIVLDARGVARSVIVRNSVAGEKFVGSAAGVVELPAEFCHEGEVLRVFTTDDKFIEEVQLALEGGAPRTTYLKSTWENIDGRNDWCELIKVGVAVGALLTTWILWWAGRH